MKVLLQAYNTYRQNLAGGVQTKISNLYSSLRKINDSVELFNKWKNRIDDYELIHFFKLSIEHYNLMVYAKDKGKKIVLSSIVPINDYLKIKIHLAICKILPLHTVFDLHKKMLDLSDVIIAETEREKSFIIDAYSVNSDKIVLVPNGVSNNVLNGNPEYIKNEIGISEPCVLQVGRIDKNKNQLNTIRAMKGLDIPLVFVGGPDPADLEYYNQCLKEATNNVYFLGWVEQNDELLASAYSLAKVVILPSHRETFGIALIEGAAVGANIIASSALPLLEDWGIDEYSLKVNPNDVSDIKEKIITAYHQDTPMKLKEIINSQFSWEAIAQRHLDIYNSLVI